MTPRALLLALAPLCLAAQSGDVSDAVRKAPAKHPAAPAKRPAAAAPKVDPDANTRAVMKFASFGRDCPKHRRMLTKWDQPLQFVLQRDVSPAVLVITGEFTAGDSDRLRSFLASAGPIAEVQFDSGGGDAEEGPKIGRVIRAARLSTRVASGFACISSCSMAFLGGVLRKIDSDAIYGLHTFFNSKLYEGVLSRTSADGRRNFLHMTEQRDAMLGGQIQEYGQEMGISRRFFTDVMFAQRSEVFVSDARLGQLRAALRSPLEPKAAEALTLSLVKDGIVPVGSDQEKSEAVDLMDWMTKAHSADDVDAKLAAILSNDFRCISPYQLSRYNITNVAS